MNHRNEKTRGTVHPQSYVAIPRSRVLSDTMCATRELTMRINASPRPESRLP